MGHLLRTLFSVCGHPAALSFAYAMRVARLAVASLCGVSCVFRRVRLEKSELNRGVHVSHVSCVEPVVSSTR